MRKVFITSLILGLCACGSEKHDKQASAGKDADGPGGDGDAVVSDAGGVEDAGQTETDAGHENPGTSSVTGNTMTIGPVLGAAHGEKTVCVVLELGNADTLYVRELKTHIDPGSHHMIAYKTDEDVVTTPYPCAPSPNSPGLMIIAQSTDSALPYPEVAVASLAPHQHVRLELHYFNDNAMAREMKGAVTFVPHEGDATKLLPVQTLFTGAYDLEVPTGESESKYFQVMPPGNHYFALTTHTHRLGVLATLKRAKSQDDESAVLLHESRDWDEPPLTQFNPPIMFAGDGLLLTCEYDNYTGQPVHFGTNATDEMCFFWAYYY
jgi:hypothetical protein